MIEPGIQLVDPAVDADLVAAEATALISLSFSIAATAGMKKLAGTPWRCSIARMRGMPARAPLLSLAQLGVGAAAIAQLDGLMVAVEGEGDGKGRPVLPACRLQRAPGADMVDGPAPDCLGPCPGIVLGGTGEVMMGGSAVELEAIDDERLAGHETGFGGG